MWNKWFISFFTCTRTTEITQGWPLCMHRNAISYHIIIPWFTSKIKTLFFLISSADVYTKLKSYIRLVHILKIATKYLNNLQGNLLFEWALDWNYKVRGHYRWSQLQQFNLIGKSVIVRLPVFCFNKGMYGRWRKNK